MITRVLSIILNREEGEAHLASRRILYVVSRCCTQTIYPIGSAPLLASVSASVFGLEIVYTRQHPLVVEDKMNAVGC